MIFDNLDPALEPQTFFVEKINRSFDVFLDFADIDFDIFKPVFDATDLGQKANLGHFDIRLELRFQITCFGFDFVPDSFLDDFVNRSKVDLGEHLM